MIPPIRTCVAPPDGAARLEPSSAMSVAIVIGARWACRHAARPG